MGRLSIFSNELNKEPEKQLQQINLALEGIIDWGNRIKSAELVDIISDGADSTASTTYLSMKGLTTDFVNSSPLVRVDLTVKSECL